MPGSTSPRALSPADQRRDVRRRCLTVPEVGAWLRISRGQVFNLVQEKRIQSFRIGRSRRVTARAVREYMASLQKGD
jgi:excisionase family DNA binding protein